MKSHFSG